MRCCCCKHIKKKNSYHRRTAPWNNLPASLWLFSTTTIRPLTLNYFLQMCFLCFLLLAYNYNPRDACVYARANNFGHESPLGRGCLPACIVHDAVKLEQLQLNSTTTATTSETRAAAPPPHTFFSETKHKILKIIIQFLYNYIFWILNGFDKFNLAQKFCTLPPQPTAPPQWQKTPDRNQHTACCK